MPRTFLRQKPTEEDDEVIPPTTANDSALANVAEPAPAQPLDANAEGGQISRTGQVSEGELELEVARKVAKRLGWTPQEEWKRDPAKWRDAPEFLEETPRHIESLRDQNKRMGQAAEAAIEEARRAALEEARAELAAATE